MNIVKLAAAPLILASLGACTNFPGYGTPATSANDGNAITAPVILGIASLNLADGTSAGNARIEDDGGAIRLIATLQNLPSGARAFHLHTEGKCDAPDFTSAGGHLNPLGKNHGTRSPGGAHVGDLPNIQIAADGSGSITAPIEGSAQQVRQWLFDTDGTSVMVHAGPDDYRTDPSGAAGARIACGILTRP